MALLLCIKLTAFGTNGRVSMLNRSIVRWNYAPRDTEIDDVEYLDSLVAACADEDASVGTDCDIDDRAEMATILFNKFNSDSLLFPEFDDTVQRSCDDEVGERRQCHICKCIAMHE